MSIDMYLSESRTQADSVATRCDSRVKGYESLQKAISDFYFNSQGLSGKTYDSAKEYFMSVLYPLAQGGVLLSEATKEAIKRFPEEYTARVDTCDWKESELIESLTQIDQQIRNLYDIRSNIEYYPMPDLIKTILIYANEEQIQLYQDMNRAFSEKLDRLREFNASSPDIFSEIDALESSIKQGLAQVKSSWNASSGTFMMPQDLSWVKSISNVKNAKIIAIYREQYGFDDETIELLLKTQKGISPKNEHEYFAMLAGLCDNYRAKRWTITAGTLDLEKTKAYFKKLGLTDEEVEKLYQAINQQHDLVSEDTTPDNLRTRDFAHEMIALAIFKNQTVAGDTSLPIVTGKGMLDLFMFGQINQFSSYKGDAASGRIGRDDKQSDTDVTNIYNRYIQNQTSILSEYSI
ncbi:hypothetical protein D9N16_10830 [Lactococcus raffinolactis]|uniref:LXG domain-containing protein n=1 Tax=Pseudolactococcus raffinolactis TaxID=1366 RepID=UPI001C7044B1|nr:LXG domain-containing protein [Lactococcus raffinolactis]MBW9299205.1 hypothetical protein [Lactococcus raffinolactis]